MKAVVAVPSVLDFYFTPSRASALGALAVKQLLEKENIDSVLFNFPAAAVKPVKIGLPPELGHLEDHIIKGENGPVSFFSSNHRYGPDHGECAAVIAAEKPDILFISCFAWAYAAETVSLAAEVKRLCPELSVAAGGAGVTVNPAYFESFPAIDHVLTGEAETAVPALLSGIGGRACAPPEGEPRFLLAETGFSSAKNKSFYSAILTRGCPKSCSFCSNYLVHGRKFRKADSGKVIEKLLSLPEDRNIHVNFEDDNILFAPDYFTGILEAVRERFPSATFSAENGLDYTMLDDRLLERLLGLGFNSFNLSMASSSSALLRGQNRPAAPERLESITAFLAKRKISSVTYFICGLDGEQPEDAVDNLIRLHGLPTLSGISLFYPVPGLPVCRQDFSSIPPRLCAGSSAWPWTGSLTTGQLITAFRLSRLSNLIKTEDGTIGGGTRSSFRHTRELIDRIRESGRLFSFARGKIVEVPGQDHPMVEGFLSRISK